MSSPGMNDPQQRFSGSLTSVMHHWIPHSSSFQKTILYYCDNTIKYSETTVTSMSDTNVNGKEEDTQTLSHTHPPFKLRSNMHSFFSNRAYCAFVEMFSSAFVPN